MARREAQKLVFCSQINARTGHVPRQIAARTDAQLFLHVVNPNVSWSTGRHVLDVEARTRHYGLDLWARDEIHYAMYRGLYLCEGDITAAELVRGWWWDDLVKNDRCCDDIIMPAFKKNDRKLQAHERESTRKRESGVRVVLRECGQCLYHSLEAAKAEEEDKRCGAERQTVNQNEGPSESDEDAVVVPEDQALREWKTSRPTICSAK
ncbi:hypothetical protein BDW72DRAFT_191281 [Aspergillus terricola var. indicus]